MMGHFKSRLLNSVSSSVPRCSRQHWILLSVAALLATSACGAARGHSPVVDFDVSYMIGCRDVTPDEFAELHRDEKLLEAKFQVSSLLQRGSQENIIHYLYQIDSPHKTIEVVDYSPRTTLATDVVGNLGVQTSRERARSIGIAMSGSYDHLIKADASGSKNKKSTSSQRYELLPPLELLAASGTTQRGAGAYFKLKPSKRTSLEGAKDFGLVLRVPRSWRADVVRIGCEATSRGRRLVDSLDNDLVVCGRDKFVVAIYADGDEGAKQAAAELVQAELQFRDAAATRRDELENRSYPRFQHKLGRLFGVADPKLPTGWLERVIESSSDTPLRAYARHLPVDVRDAAAEYLHAKRRLRGLNGQSEQKPATISSQATTGADKLGTVGSVDKSYLGL